MGLFVLALTYLATLWLFPSNPVPGDPLIAGWPAIAGLVLSGLGLWQGSKQAGKANKMADQASQHAMQRWQDAAPLRDLANQNLFNAPRELPDLRDTFADPSNPFYARPEQSTPTPMPAQLPTPAPQAGAGRVANPRSIQGQVNADLPDWVRRVGGRASWHAGLGGA